MDALQAIQTRRSTRTFLEKTVEKHLIEEIIEAGRYAPSGGNSQTTHFIVLSKKETLNALKDLVQQAFSDMEVEEGMYASIASSIKQSKAGNYVFHYNAPVLVVVANKKGYGNAMADSACALENMMIAANAKDLGSCWINQLHWLDENPVIRNYMKQFGLDDSETITGALALGYPIGDSLNRTPLERKGNPVTWEE